MTELVLPAHANALGTIFGGVVMGWMDICAAIAAQKHARCTVVTVAVDQLHFLRPICVGDVVLLESEVTGTGRTSIEVRVQVQRERLIEGEVPEDTTQAYFTFVAVDAEGGPIPVPALDAKSPEDRRRLAESKRRREARVRSGSRTPT